MKLILIALLFAFLLTSQGTQQADEDIAATLININKIALWIHADGRSASKPTREPGAVFPRGTEPAANVLYADGIFWGGQVYDGKDPVLRVGGQHYDTGTRSGTIQAGDGNYENRIWRIRRDYFSADLTLETTELGLATEEIREQYAKDWREWPAEKGAPFYDADSDGIYEPEFYDDGSPVLFPEADEPGLLHADQVVWLVANDLDSTVTTSFYGSPPIGLEMQVTLWGYDTDTMHLDNVIFKRCRLIYKGTSVTVANAGIDSMYIAQWSDVEIGSFGDDLVGCDTTLDITFAYNSRYDDALYSQLGLPPPAVGYALLSGPLTPAPGEVAAFDFREIKDYRNLTMSSFTYYYRHSTVSGPTRGDYSGTLQWWNILRGYLPRPEIPSQPVIHPFTHEPTKFVLTGDPVTGAGWVDSNPGDRRMLFSIGPFTMALGDTQEVILALVAGLGADRLSSISVMKYFAGLTKFIALNNFQVSLEEEVPETPLPEFFQLHRNFPNPFNPSTQIRYELPGEFTVKLTIYNILGERIKTLVNDIQEAGTYTVNWDGKNEDKISSPSGLYFYKIQLGRFTETKKMLLVR